MKPTTSWLNEVRPRVPGIDRAYLMQEIEAAIREFYIKSGAWLKELPCVNIVAGQTHYHLNPQAEGWVMTVVMTFIDGVPYPPMQEKYPTTMQYSNYVTCTEAGVVTVHPTPTEDITGGLKVFGIMKPRAITHSVPDEAVELWFDPIMDGILGRLYSQPKKPWTDQALAVYHLKRFRNGIAEARDTTRRKYSFAESEFLFPPWA